MMDKLVIKSVNISDRKGVIKIPVDHIDIIETGVKHDAHAGNWHRQISLLGSESIDKLAKELNRNIEPGEFAENITINGFNVKEVKILDRIICGSVVLEVTQIGKKCHGDGCAIYSETGNCVMPKEGIFCRVINNGSLRAGDILIYKHKVIEVHIITLSDRAAAGEYKDKSGPFLNQLITKYFTDNNWKIKITQSLIPDNELTLKQLILDTVNTGVDMIFTTGGTGIGPKDITPDVVKPLLEKEITGIMELIRVKYGMNHPNALISRSVAGVRGKTLIYTLPGSPKAVKEYSDEILKTVEHSLRMLYSIDSH